MQNQIIMVAIYGQIYYCCFSLLLFSRPSFIRTVVDAIAEVKKVPVDDVVEQIAKNFEVFFEKKLR